MNSVRHASVLAGAEKVSTAKTVWNCEKHFLLETRIDVDWPPLQAPLSRVEPGQYLNDRYTAIEDRLAVCTTKQGL